MNLKGDINIMKNCLIYMLKVSYLHFVNYSYIIFDKVTNKAAIVDPAWEYSSIKRLIEEIGAELSYILLTHSHFDHVNLVGKLVAEYGSVVYMSSLEAEYYNFKCTSLCLIDDMDIIKLGNTYITCILTPGHTVGSVCYYVDNNLFTGDTLFIEGCGICDTEGGCPTKMYESIQKIKEVTNDNTVIYPGHSYGEDLGKPIEYVKLKNIYFQIDRVQDFVNFRMRKNQKNLYDFY